MTRSSSLSITRKPFLFSCGWPNPKIFTGSVGLVLNNLSQKDIVIPPGHVACLKFIIQDSLIIPKCNFPSEDLTGCDTTLVLESMRSVRLVPFLVRLAVCVTFSIDQYKLKDWNKGSIMSGIEKKREVILAQSVVWKDKWIHNRCSSLRNDDGDAVDNVC